MAPQRQPSDSVSTLYESPTPSARRKVLVISGAFPPSNSGEGQHTLLLSRHLASRGFEVEVLTSAGGVADDSMDVRPLMREWSWRELPLFARSLRSSSPDVVLLMYIGWIYNDHPMVTYAPTIARLLLPRVRFVTQFENAIGAVPEQDGFVGRLRARAAGAVAGAWKVDYRFGTLLRDSHRIIVLSERHRSILAAHVSSVSGKSLVIPPPPLMMLSPDTRETRRRGRELLGATADDFVLVYLGYVYPRKGLETLLSAFGIVARERENVRLAVVGGPLEGFEHYATSIRELPAELGIENRVRWTGAYPWDSIDGSMMLRAADAYVMPIDIGVALNNSSIGAAAAHGIPLIATAAEDLEPAFREQENVVLCRPRDPDGMAAAIRMVMDHDQLRARLSEGARSLAEQWFSWETAVDRTIESFGD
jgi:polysaccharide biosynthesis protein PslF